ncbi:B-cell differentiation antigen CD72-like [Ochotona princeps]|uniref:B-cell differentiation antigen CD72-like n=1 Tax=Ochotona princeps TaxID=9978 RepID=UPI00271488B2|nr:B-cell differentiation antigen CD72-like [Ochotona princeps]
MAEANRHADLRFVKAPLRKNVSDLGQDTDENGELSYNDMQVHSSPEAPTGLVLSPIPEDRAGHGHSGCLKYFLLGLLLTCLLVRVAAICLGVQYLYGSQQFGQLSRVLEATNSSLQEQLHLRTVQLGQMEKDLQDSKTEMARRLTALQEEQRAHQPVREQLQACQADRENTQKTLQAMQQKLNHLQDTVKLLLTCPSQGICCMVGWILIQRRCFHISLTKRNWQESQEYCKSLSSDLTTFTDTALGYYSESSSRRSLLLQLSVDTPYWVGHRSNNYR